MAEAETAAVDAIAPKVEASPAAGPAEEKSSVAPAPGAGPSVRTSRAWSFDRETGILKVNGKEFKLAVPAEDLVKFSQGVSEDLRAHADTSQALASLGGLVSGFERGEWKNYSNAGQRIKILHQEVSKMQKEAKLTQARLESRAASFGKLWEPEGLYAEFGSDSLSYTKMIRTVLQEFAKA